MLSRYRLQIISCLTGAIAGYLLLHPYSMLIYALIHFHQGAEVHLHWEELILRSIAALDPMMLPMAVSFACFGGAIGLLTGILLNRAKKISVMKHENEKKKVALDTLQEVMVTLAHHLLNANMIIGGKVRHIRKATSDQDLLAALDAIEEQGRKIDIVVGALRKATEIKVAQYTSDGAVNMIDITGEIEEQMQRVKR